MLSSHLFISPKKRPKLDPYYDEMENQKNEKHEQLKGVGLNNMEMEDVDVCENFHQHLDQPFGFGQKARKMKMVHKKIRHSIQITRKK
jgi:hypothetical protein